MTAPIRVLTFRKGKLVPVWNCTGSNGLPRACSPRESQEVARRILRNKSATLRVTSTGTGTKCTVSAKSYGKKSWRPLAIRCIDLPTPSSGTPSPPKQPGKRGPARSAMTQADWDRYDKQAGYVDGAKRKKSGR